MCVLTSPNARMNSAISFVLPARFMPNPLAAGHLHLSFPTHPPSSLHHPFALLRPSHFPLAVIGVASSSRANTLSSIHSQFSSALLDTFPASSLYPLARVCFVFEEDDNATNLNASDSPSGIVVIPSMMGNKKLYIGTLLADLCSQILAEFGIVVREPSPCWQIHWINYRSDSSPRKSTWK